MFQQLLKQLLQKFLEDAVKAILQALTRQAGQTPPASPGGVLGLAAGASDEQIAAAVSDYLDS